MDSTIKDISDDTNGMSQKIKLVNRIFRYLVSIALIIYLITMLTSVIKKITEITANKPHTVQEQLATFNDAGIIINKGVDFDTIISNWGGERKIEEEPYSLMYIALGTTIKKEPWTPVTDTVWHLDTEAIVDHGDYVTLVENFGRISNGELDFQNIKDYVGLEEGKAWVSFDLNGDSYKWELHVDNDWIDPDFFIAISELPTEYKTKGRLVYFDTGGQDIVWAWFTPKQVKTLKESTGLELKIF